MILELTPERLPDIPPSEPFPVIGRLIPALNDGVWSAREQLFDTPTTKTFPPEDRDLTRFIGSEDRKLFLYYDGDVCAGLIRVRAGWNRYAFIEDLAVRAAYRGRGVGTALLRHAEQWATSRALPGMTLEAQDVNLIACRFYLKNGYAIGGVDTRLYAHFDTRDETAIFFYKSLTE